MKLVFVLSKTNRYSIAALFGAIEDLEVDVEVIGESEFINANYIGSDDAIIALSFMSPEAKKNEKLIRKLSSAGNRVIVGGPHASAKPEEILGMGAYAVFVGEGERTLRKFLLNPTPGIWYGEKLQQLDTFPPFSLKHEFFSPMEISRGCPFGCNYCQTPRIFGRRVRHRSVENILHFARESVERGRKVARFITPNAFGYGSKNGVTPNTKVIYELLSGMRKIGMREVYFGSFPSDVRPESVSDDVLAIVQEFCDNKVIVVGLQSGSDRILKQLNRGHDVQTAINTIRKISRYGFTPYVDMIFGFPFEEDSDIEKSFEVAYYLYEKYGAVIHGHTFMPLPGTPFENLKSKLSSKTLRELGRLSAKGIMKGQWQNQITISQEISHSEPKGE
ncbi:radical SAM protein [Kosmotoga sp. DU53]|uniref:Radical SAM domain protein n=1 Tax=Kosmotoga olearia (strain ATCC BAA-1733 / DSM 21960 / TBF 19.5.1) TaxID=521045 RepID=C5CE37_KOSOT|nr:Radical SAM domain protein [Kosmotoga olearia TBF 19.5.1]MDI3523726.1 hypothetical protein [Kosmotoga sp.]MDK2953214.1 hypothetical protein [Kosmotoga sp.]OAA20329.1 radical SAM protein [Kosmotoga sp. DU53]